MADGMYGVAKSAQKRRISPVVWIVAAIVAVLVVLGGWDGAKLAALGIVSFAIYFLPLAVAVKREHPQKNAIGILNFFAGWTFIGWVVAIVWAFIEPKS